MESVRCGGVGCVRFGRVCEWLTLILSESDLSMGQFTRSCECEYEFG